MKATNIQIKAALLAGLALLGVASANAQEVTWLRNVEVNQEVPDRGQSVSLLDMANSGLGSISDVKVNLSLSSVPQQNPMWLGQIYSTLTYGVASEGARTAVGQTRGNLERAIREVGREPAQRNTFYELV